MKKIILLYLNSNTNEDALKIQEVVASMDYELKVVVTKDLSQNIGYLMHMDGFVESNDENSEEIAFDAMVLPSMDQEELKLISTSLKDQSINITRKAMLTEHNQQWTFLALLKEINEEYQYFAKRYELQNLIMACTKLDQSKVTPAFQKEIMIAYDILQNQESLKLDFEQAINMIMPMYASIVKQTS